MCLTCVGIVVCFGSRTCREGLGHDNHHGVVAQVDAIETAIGEVVHMIFIENSELGESSAFRLEVAPVCRYFETRGALSKFDMAGGISTETQAAASEKLVSMFDPETRARLAGLALAESTRLERERLEAERIAAEEDLGGGEEEETRNAFVLDALQRGVLLRRDGARRNSTSPPAVVTMLAIFVDLTGHNTSVLLNFSRCGPALIPDPECQPFLCASSLPQIIGGPDRAARRSGA